MLISYFGIVNKSVTGIQKGQKTLPYEPTGERFIKNSGVWIRTWRMGMIYTSIVQMYHVSCTYNLKFSISVIKDWKKTDAVSFNNLLCLV
jgi:hypothetical protein